jgi:hypothetical protein
MVIDHESRKAAQELADFQSFLKAAALAISFGSERSGNAALKEPDIICVLDGQTTGFELTAACAPEFAAAAKEASRSDSGVSSAFGEDVSVQTLRKKLAKKYTVQGPVHLLIYRGLTALTDEMVIHRLMPELRCGLGPFKKIWFHGDNVYLLAAADG